MKVLRPQTKISLENLVKLERCGLYEQALSELEDVWRDDGKPPDIADCTPYESAEVFLRRGSLIGFHGHNKQIIDAQVRSKDLLTEAHRRFSALNLVEKIAECENYLALAYWRTGELNEAETFVAEALSRPLADASDTRLYSHLIKSLILLSFGRNAEVVADTARFESDFRRFGDAFLNGSYATNAGIACNELGRQAEALKKFELARFYHQKSRHRIYLGTVENNLAQLYKIEKQFAKAHEAADDAAKIFRRIKDQTRTGFVCDTKAQIFFAEGKYAEGLEAVEKAVEILKKSENSSYLAESYLTKAKILLYHKGFSAAVLALVEAIKITEQSAGEHAALKLVENFEEVLAEKNKPIEPTPDATAKSENLELILPSPLAQYEEIQVVRIRSDHLASAGLPKDSLAVVAQIEVRRGDLAAVSELATDAVVCGFYDAEFGIVCLESKSGEPYLFDENEIVVLGKIVGVCRSENTLDGKMIVEELIF